MLVFCATAFADIAREPPPDRVFVTQAVRVEGVDRHSGFVLVIAEPGAEVREVAAWDAAQPGTRTLVDGGGRLGPAFVAPRVGMMTADAYAAWQRVAADAEAAQRAACERGEGCMHISRFVPSLPAPQGLVDCGLAPLALPEDGPADGPDTVTTVLDWVEAAPDRCVVTLLRTEGSRSGAAVVLAPASAPTAGGGCCGLGAGTASGASLILLAARRRARA